MSIRLIVFDKDGTLIAWSVWDGVIGAVLDEFVVAERRAEAAAALDYDLVRREVLAGSPVIAGSNAEVIDLLAPFAEERRGLHARVEARFAALANDHVAERPGATEILRRARDSGIAVALCTNDSEAAARSQVAGLGWTELIPFVYGYDSGHGSKPRPGMLLAALAAAGCDVSEAVMVGDSAADMIAAAGAGMRGVYVGVDDTGRRYADVQLADLSELFDLLDSAG